ncbi:MAG: DNA-binding protein [Methylotenera sp.]
MSHVAAFNKGLEEVRQMFRDDGISVACWARDRGFSLPLVYAVLSGRNRASRGESYKISVALGLRPAPRHVDFFRPKSADSVGVNPITSLMENTM